MIFRKILKGIGILVVVSLFITLVGFVTMHLWNWLIPDLFKGPQIDLLQALGLLILGKLLFGGFHGRRGGWRGGPGGHWSEHARERWRAKMEAKWSSMTPEEREKKREAFQRHCGHRRWGWDEPGPGAPTESNEPKS